MTTKEQHIEDTKYLQWADGMYVMLEDLHDDYELAVVENSLRDSVYADQHVTLFNCTECEDSAGVAEGDAGLWWAYSYQLTTKLTRAQALYISTGQTCF
jgi:hypothetical protein